MKDMWLRATYCHRFMLIHSFFLRALDVGAAATAAEKTAVTHSKLLSHCALPPKLELSISVAVVVVEYHM